jgi:hypothetical protein
LELPRNNAVADRSFSLLIIPRLPIQRFQHAGETYTPDGALKR